MTHDNRLVAIIIEVSDLDRSATLYREGFGLDLHASDHASNDRWIGGSHAALSWTDGAYLHFALSQANGPEITTGAQIGLAPRRQRGRPHPTRRGGAVDGRLNAQASRARSAATAPP